MSDPTIAVSLLALVAIAVLLCGSRRRVKPPDWHPDRYRYWQEALSRPPESEVVPPARPRPSIEEQRRARMEQSSFILTMNRRMHN